MSKRKIEATRANQARKGNAGRRPPPGYAAGGATGPGGRRRRTQLIVLVAVLAVAALAILATTVFGKGSGASFKALVASKTCVANSYKDEGHDHWQEADLQKAIKQQKYKTNPPTSGKHFIAPAALGWYLEPIPNVIQVHNLEHGQILVQYGNKVPASAIAKLKRDLEAHREFTLAAPRPSLGDKVAYTAWRHSLICTGYQTTALRGAQASWGQGRALAREPGLAKENRLPGW